MLNQYYCGFTSAYAILSVSGNPVLMTTILLNDYLAIVMSAWLQEFYFTNIVSGEHKSSSYILPCYDGDLDNELDTVPDNKQLKLHK